MQLFVENVRKQYESEGWLSTRLDGIQFSADHGDFVCIIGPAGSGKSSLLYILALLDLPSSGTLHMDGMEIGLKDTRTLEKFRTHNIGLLMDNPYLLPHLNVLENILLPMQLVGKIKRGHREQTMNRLANLGMEEKALAYPETLSRDQQQLVALARALANKPSLLLLDDPTRNMDENTAKAFIGFLLHLKKKEKFTVILATTDIKIAAVGNKIFYLDKGKLLTTAF